MAAVAPEGEKNSDSSKKWSLLDIPDLSFADVEKYAARVSGSSTGSMKKAYKYFAEPGYLHDYKVHYSEEETTISSKCYRSMKKSESPHAIFIIYGNDKHIEGKCSCVAGAGGACQHVLAVLLLMAHCKQLGLMAFPDELTCTMTTQRWSVPRGRKICPVSIDMVQVKKPREGANYTKSIKSSLYSPASHYLLLHGPVEMEKLLKLSPEPLICSLLPNTISNLPAVSTKFGNVPHGCTLSHQQKLSSAYLINDYANASFPALPLLDSSSAFSNNYCVCLNGKQLGILSTLSVNGEQVHELEEKTRDQSTCQLWHSLRNKRITASKFGLVAKRQANFESLVDL